MTCIAPHQPAFLPWLGYLARIIEADIFVALDSVQYEEGGWQNRNYICRNGQLQRVTVPVRRRGRFSQLLMDTQTDEEQPWRKKLLRTLDHAYGRQPHWPDVHAAILGPVLEDGQGAHSLTETNLLLIDAALRHLGIDTPVVRSSTLGLHSTKDQLLVDLAQALDAETVIVGRGSESYLGPLPCEHQGVRFVLSRFTHPTYEQGPHPFVPNSSFLDLLVRLPAAECHRLLTEALT